jgi:toxin ParE1/3/4
VKQHRFLEDADSEFFEWIAHYDRVSRTLGDRFVAAIETAVVNIRTYPEIGSSIGKALRKLVVTEFPHSVIYANETEEIVIIAVAHHKRRPGYWRRRLRSLQSR